MAGSVGNTRSTCAVLSMAASGDTSEAREHPGNNRKQNQEQASTAGMYERWTAILPKSSLMSAAWRHHRLNTCSRGLSIVPKTTPGRTPAVGRGVTLRRWLSWRSGSGMVKRPLLDNDRTVLWGIIGANTCIFATWQYAMFNSRHFNGNKLYILADVPSSPSVTKL